MEIHSILIKFCAVLTLQFGTQSNYVMTHCWNILDEQLKVAEETSLRLETLYYETEKGRMPLALVFDRKDAFGNFFGYFDAQMQDVEDAEQDILRQWQGGYVVTQEDKIEKSEFAQALDGIDDEIEEERRRKELEQDDYDRQQRIWNDALENRNTSGDQKTSSQSTVICDMFFCVFKGIFEQFLKASIQQENNNNEEVIDTQNKETKEEKKEETPQELYHKFKFNEKKIRFFTDYMQCLLSQKSKVEIPNYPGSFALFSEGKGLLNDYEALDDMTDHFRNMLERSDNIQGLRLLVDTDTGFGSFAAKYIQEIKDEIPKKKIMLYSIMGVPQDMEMYKDERESIVNELRAYNLPFSISYFNELADAIVPINLNYKGQISRYPDYLTDYDDEYMFHKSSIPSLAINDFFGAITQKKSTYDLESILHPLTLYRRANIHLNCIKLPFITEVNTDLPCNKLFYENKINEFYKAKEFIHLSSPFWGPLYTKLPIHSQLNWTGATHKDYSSSVLLDQGREYCLESFSSHNLSVLQDRALLPIPFPRYFTNKMNYNGDICLKETNDFVNNISTFSSLYCTPEVGGIIENVFLKTIKYMPYEHKIQFLKEDYCEEDQFVEFRETLQAVSDDYFAINNMGDNHDEGWSDEDMIEGDDY